MANRNIVIDLTEKDEVRQLTKSKDFTVWWKNTPEHLPPILRDHFSNESVKVFNDDVMLLIPGETSPQESKARACICRCSKDGFLSGTFRSDKKPECKPTESNSASSWSCSSWGEDGDFALETFELVEAMFKTIWPKRQSHPATVNIGVQFETADPSGLIVFAGRTNSAKSIIAKAMALRIIQDALLRRNAADDRLPHLVSFEDPIESWTITRSPNVRPTKDEKEFTNHPIIDPSMANELGFCFTARDPKTDVLSLTEALQDAKRQTPACFFVGEVRRPEDWKCLIEFAGSGHLVIATTHASSLPEIFLRILTAKDAKTPAERRTVCGVLTACVHLDKRKVSLDTGNMNGHGLSDGKEPSIVLPMIWSRTSAAHSSLVSDGISSITPNRQYVLSRCQFLEQHFFGPNGPYSSTSHRGDLSDRDKSFLIGAVNLARKIDLEALVAQ